MPPPTALRVISVEDGVAVGEIDRVCAVVWRGAVTRPRFELQRRGLAEVARRHREGIGFACVIEPGAPPPDHELRRASAAMIREHEASLRGIACVVEGSGFGAAIARSALAAIGLILGPRDAPLTVVPTVDAATRWLVPRVRLEDAGALAGAVEALRAELPPAAR